MEYRKIIGFGTSSYVVSIPKQWMKQHGLEKGHAISLNQENESLILSPTQIAKETSHPRTIHAEDKSDKLIQREIVSAYIAGCNPITIIGRDLLGRDLRKTFENLVALEIVSYENTKIIAHDFLEIETVEINELVRRIDNTIRAMLLELDESTHTEVAFEHLRYRDDSINKLAFLSYRTIRALLTNPSKTRESMLGLFRTWTCVLQLERCGDEIKRASRTATPQLSERIRELGELYKACMKAYYDENTESALKLSESCRTFQRKAKEHDTKAAERLVNMASYLEEILRLTYDFV